MKNVNLLFIIIAVMAIVACGKKTDVAKVIEQQKELTEQWDKALNAHDPDALASLYAEDATRMHQNVPALKGREAIRTFFKTEFEEIDGVVDNTTVNVIVSGEYAICNGTYTAEDKIKSDSTLVHDVGKWVSIRKLQDDGTWKTIIDIWNSDLPAVTTTE